MAILVARRGSGYTSVRDVWLRSGLDVARSSDSPRPMRSGRSASTAGRRWWAVRGLDAEKSADRLPLFDRGYPARRQRAGHPQPVMPPGQHVIHDYRRSACRSRHTRRVFVRERLDRSGVTPNARLSTVPNGRRVVVSGLILVRQRPGKGNAIFLTLEDEGGIANIIVWKRDFDRCCPSSWARNSLRWQAGCRRSRMSPTSSHDRIEDLTSWLTVLLEGAGDSADVGDGSRGGAAVKTVPAPFVRKNGPVDHEMLAREAGG